MRLIFKFLNMIFDNAYFLLNFFIFKKNFISYNSIFLNKYKSYYKIFINYPYISRYNWAINNSYFVKYLHLNYLNISKFNLNFNKKFSVIKKINDFIFFKKKSSIIKKNSDYEYNILFYSNNYKDDYYLNNKLHIVNYNKKPKSTKKNKVKKNSLVKNFDSFYFDQKINFKRYKKNKRFKNLKTIDFKKKINLVFEKNRLLLKKFLNIKFIRKNNFNKKIQKLIKLDNLNFFLNFELRLFNILTRSLFFFNYNDCVWFIKNGYVSINGFVEYNPNRLLKPLEIVNVAYNNYFFFYYRFLINNCINNLYKFNMKIWKIRSSRFNAVEKKKKTVIKYPNWIYKYMYYKHDIPKFIEVDFISMSLVLLSYSFNKKYFDFYNIKFLNIYLSRIYNWKNVT